MAVSCWYAGIQSHAARVHTIPPVISRRRLLSSEIEELCDRQPWQVDACPQPTQDGPPASVDLQAPACVHIC